MEITLPQLVVLSVNVADSGPQKHEPGKGDILALDAFITLPIPAGGVDGHCGNANGDISDESKELFKQEMKRGTWKVQPSDSLFLRRSEEADCDETLRGTNDYRYRGCQSIPRSGKKCQSWDTQAPHTHSRRPDNPTYAGMGLGSHNYCRNPDGEQSIWCYTMDA